MSASQILQQDSCVTTVYEVLRKCDPARLADVVFSGHSVGSAADGAVGTAIDGAPCPNRRLLASHLGATLEAILTVAPDLDESAQIPLDIGKAVDCERLYGLSWPRALGTRVVMPSDESSRRWLDRATIVFGHVSSL